MPSCIVVGGVDVITPGCHAGRAPLARPGYGEAMDTRRLDDDIAGCAAAHQRLLDALDGLADDDARRPSLLPGWSVGHVLTHLARNADSFTQIVAAAGGDEPVAQYPGGAAQREHDIETGSGRPAAALVDDVRRSIWRLEQAWAGATTEAWQGRAAGLHDTFSVIQLPARRWREVEIHHSDLGIGFTWRDWSPEFVRRNLPGLARVWASRRPMGMTELPPAALSASPHERLAWLVGRVEIEGLEPAGIF